ncbi:MAG: hypothetical protein IK047_00965, partial [Clostridia bacterium]|nr:hypothetical protein [Clostridia bacterium]
MRFLRFLKNELLYVGLNKEEFDRVKEPVGEHNRKAIISWAGIVGLFCIICLFIFRDPVYAEGRAVLFVSLAVSAVAMACALFLIKRFRRLLFPAMYLLQLSVLGTGIALAVVQPDKRTATMVAFALIIPVFFVDRTIITVALQTAAIIAFVVFGKNVIVPEVYSWGWQTLAVFSMAGVISGHMINKSRFERFVYADSAKKLADIQKNYNEELQKEVAAKTERIVELHDRLIIGMATMVESRD